MSSTQRLNHASRPSALVTAPPVAFASLKEADWYTNAEEGSRRLLEAYARYYDKHVLVAG